MTGSIKTKTPKYKFIIPQFNIATWHDYIEDNFRAIDALFFNIFDIQNFSGSWTKTTEYKKDQVLFIPEDYEVDETGQLKRDDQGKLIVSEFSGRMVKVLKDHTTDNSDYFSLYYFNHKDEYELFADASTAQKFANLAKQYSENAQQFENNAELYKNNAQGYAQEAESSKNIAQQNAQLATNKAELAASSATIAKNSENSAASSATLAEGYKNDAKKSADSAKSSEDITVENVQTVNGLVQDPNLVTVSTDLRSASSNIKNVSSISEQTKNVSDNMYAVVDVSNNKTNINNVSVNMPFVEDVSENIEHIVAVNRNKANIDNVATNKTNINNVAENITSVNNVSENMSDVKNAVQSANDAKLWAVGTKTEKPEGSSKYWAEQAKNVVQTPDATETVKGIVRLATSDEVTAGTNDSAVITPLKLKSSLDTKQDKSTAVNYNNITNCITEIPQDIKLELNNGTLTLKAGSKVYVPNGAGKFDTVTIASNLTSTFTASSNQRMFFWNNIGKYIQSEQLANIYSGSTAPTGSGMIYWYDTTNNLIKRSTNGGSTWGTDKYSLPLGLFSVSNNNITSIDQVFNGFGYIGSTVFALPGVKGLIPNGRNVDGSLKSIEFTLNKVLTETFPNLDGSVYVTLKTNSLDYWQVAATPIGYDEVENIFINGNNIRSNETVLGISYLSNGKITSFTPKTPFHALDYNDKSTISGWSMPSNRYIDLTLGASGSTYTAPANGYVTLSMQTTTSDYRFVYLINDTTKLSSLCGVAVANNSAVCTIPVKKGAIFKAYYTAQTKNYFRFIYAEGENNV